MNTKRDNGKMHPFVFHNDQVNPTLAFVKNLCFNNSAAVGLNGTRSTEIFFSTSAEFNFNTTLT